MRINFKRALGLAALAASAMFAGQASAVTLTLGDDYYLGYSTFFSANPGNEVDVINSLRNMGTNQAPAPCSVWDEAGTPTCDRLNSDLDASLLPVASTTGGVKNETSSTTNINVTGWDYLIAKYDGPNYGSLVWYVGGLNGLFDVQGAAGPAGGTQYGLSHYSLYNFTQTTRVPEPATLGLLGLGLAGIGLARRRRRS